MTCLGTWDNLRVALVPFSPLSKLAWEIQGGGQARGVLRVGQSVARTRSWKQPNNQFGHEYGEGFTSSLKSLSPSMHMISLSRIEQTGSSLAWRSSGHWQSGQR